MILHGAGSRKENHADMAAAAAAAGLAAVRFDVRGHGETGGRLDGRALDDVAAAAALLPRGCRSRCAGRAWAATSRSWRAARAGAAAVVAICPAPAAAAGRGLRSRRLESPVDAAALERAARRRNPLEAAVAALRVPVLIQHAEGDEEVPVAGSRALARRFRHPASRLEAWPGGDHRSVQHAADAQASALAWLRASCGLEAVGPNASCTSQGRYRPDAYRTAAAHAGAATRRVAPRSSHASHSAPPTIMASERSCGDRQPGDDAVVAAQELDEEALGPRQHEVEREQAAGRRAVRAGATATTSRGAS